MDIYFDVIADIEDEIEWTYFFGKKIDFYILGHQKMKLMTKYWINFQWDL